MHPALAAGKASLLILAAFAAAACQAQVNAAQEVPPLVTATAGSLVEDSPMQTATQGPADTPEAVQSSATPPPNPLEEAATPEPRPVIAWRPPLYPVPWAMSQHDHFYFTRPIAADRINWPLPDYRYGATNFGPDLPHTGVDIVVPIGTPVYAAGPGKVTFAGVGLHRGGEEGEIDPYGLAVVMRHDFGYEGRGLQTVYAHLSQLAVEEGQSVEAGELIAYSGESGLVTGPHLHFEVRINVKNEFYSSLNPELWLAPPQGWGVLVGRVTENGNDLIHDLEIRVISKERPIEWFVKTYGTDRTINSDPFYQENFVFSDMPAGEYYLLLEHGKEVWRHDFEITGGTISYFKFSGVSGFSSELPRALRPTNVPSTLP